MCCMQVNGPTNTTDWGHSSYTKAVVPPCCLQCEGGQKVWFGGDTKRLNCAGAARASIRPRPHRHVVGERGVLVAVEAYPHLLLCLCVFCNALPRSATDWPPGDSDMHDVPVGACRAFLGGFGLICISRSRSGGVTRVRRDSSEDHGQHVQEVLLLPENTRR